MFGFLRKKKAPEMTDSEKWMQEAETLGLLEGMTEVDLYYAEKAVRMVGMMIKIKSKPKCKAAYKAMFPEDNMKDMFRRVKSFNHIVEIRMFSIEHPELMPLDIDIVQASAISFEDGNKRMWQKLETNIQKYCY